MAIMYLQSIDENFLSPKNENRISFFSSEIFSLLGIMMTISLGVISHIWQSVNTLQQQTGHDFKKTKSALRNSAYLLVLLFAFAFFIQIFRSVFSNSLITLLLNGASLLITFLYILVILDVVVASFKLGPPPKQ